MSKKAHTKSKERKTKEKPYIVALEHKDCTQEYAIIDAESPEDAFDRLYFESPGVVKDCSRIQTGLLEGGWASDDENKRWELGYKSIEKEIINACDRAPALAKKLGYVEKKQHR